MSVIRKISQWAARTGGAFLRGGVQQQAEEPEYELNQGVTEAYAAADPAAREKIDPFNHGNGKYGGRQVYRCREDREREEAEKAAQEAAAQQQYMQEQAAQYQQQYAQEQYAQEQMQQTAAYQAQQYQQAQQQYAQEQAAYQELLPVVEKKTQAIIANDLKQVQDITEIEQSAIGKISGLEQKRTEIMQNISVVLNKKLPELTLPNLIQLLDRQPDEQETLKEIHKELTDVLKRLSEVNGHNRNLIEQSLEMISYNMNLLQSTRIVPGNNYTRNAGQWDMTASQTGMFDAKQ